MKILICCNLGMSSSILMKRIREAAQRRGIDLTIAAVANADIRDEKGKEWELYDVVKDRTERNNLHHLVRAVFAAHIINDLLPAVKAEVNVDIRHGHPLRV